MLFDVVRHFIFLYLCTANIANPCVFFNAGQEMCVMPGENWTTPMVAKQPLDYMLQYSQ